MKTRVLKAMLQMQPSATQLKRWMADYTKAAAAHRASVAKSDVRPKPEFDAEGWWRGYTP